MLITHTAEWRVFAIIVLFLRLRAVCPPIVELNSFCVMICKCPLGTALPDIPKFTCGESFGQIQKLAFQRLQSAEGTVNKFTSAAAITKKASWDTLLGATDDTKVVVTPFLNAPTAEAGAARTFGGGNDSLGGIEEVIGAEPTSFSAVFRRLPQSIIKAMKELVCESQAQNLGVYLIDENGAVGAVAGDTEGDYSPIPVYSLFIGDKTLGGFEAPDSNAISFSFLPNWSDSVEVIACEFDARDL